MVDPVTGLGRKKDIFASHIEEGDGGERGKESWFRRPGSPVEGTQRFSQSTGASGKLSASHTTVGSMSHHVTIHHCDPTPHASPAAGSVAKFEHARSCAYTPCWYILVMRNAR